MNTALSRKIAMVLAALHPADRRAIQDVIPAQKYKYVAALLPQCEARLKAAGFPPANIVLDQLGLYGETRKAIHSADDRLSANEISRALQQGPKWLSEAASAALAGDREALPVSDAVRGALTRFVRQSADGLGSELQQG